MAGAKVCVKRQVRAGRQRGIAGSAGRAERCSAGSRCVAVWQVQVESVQVKRVKRAEYMMHI